MYIRIASVGLLLKHSTPHEGWNPSASFPQGGFPSTQWPVIPASLVSSPSILHSQSMEHENTSYMNETHYLLIV